MIQFVEETDKEMLNKSLAFSLFLSQSFTPIFALLPLPFFLHTPQFSHHSGGLVWVFFYFLGLQLRTIAGAEREVRDSHVWLTRSCCGSSPPRLSLCAL